MCDDGLRLFVQEKSSANAWPTQQSLALQCTPMQMWQQMGTDKFHEALTAVECRAIGTIKSGMHMNCNFISIQLHRLVLSAKSWRMHALPSHVMIAHVHTRAKEAANTFQEEF